MVLTPRWVLRQDCSPGGAGGGLGGIVWRVPHVVWQEGRASMCFEGTPEGLLLTPHS